MSAERFVGRSLRFLKVELCGELNLSGWKRAADVSERRARDVGVGGLKIRAVEQIEKLGAQLQPCFFVDWQAE